MLAASGLRDRQTAAATDTQQIKFNNSNSFASRRYAIIGTSKLEMGVRAFVRVRNCLVAFVVLCKSKNGPTFP